jgi:hypothetical protein
MSEINAIKCQSDLISCIINYPDIPYYFLVAGYGSGKTAALVLLLLYLIKRYENDNITIAVGGVTLTLLEKTLLKEFYKILIQNKIPYYENKKTNIIKIKTVTILLIPIENPLLIYAYDVNIFLCDEIDELNQDKATEVFKAINERTRAPLPDREPFKIFSTTPQGLKGTYHFIKGLKEKNAKYILIRGKTKDNPYNSKDYVNNLETLYTEDEKMAFLEGYFVNLRTGRVYPEFNEETMTVPYFEVEPHETVMIGQDLNAGFSKGTCIVKRNKILYVHKIFSFVQIGTAPTIIRTAYHSNPIFWYPDVGGQGKEVMFGYAAEIRNADIQLRMASVNPSIVDRIFFVNKLFKTGRLKICKGCESFAIALKTRAYNDLGMPEKGKGENDPSHQCDSAEYVLFRIIMSDPDFFDLKTVKIKEE